MKLHYFSSLGKGGECRDKAYVKHVEETKKRVGEKILALREDEELERQKTEAAAEWTEPRDESD